MTARLSNEKRFSNEKNVIQEIKIMVPPPPLHQPDFPN